MFLSGKARNIEQLLHNIFDPIEHIEGAVLLSYEGLPMVSTLQAEGVDVELSALVGGVSSITDRSRAYLGWDVVEHQMISSSSHHILFKDVGGEAFLALVVRPGIDWTVLLHNLNWAIYSILSLEDGNESSEAHAHL